MTKNSTRLQWYRVDLHLHTPASLDYHDPQASYLEILRRAEYRGLDVIAFTDHNTVGGYAAMMREIEQLRFLEQSGRLLPDEQRRLNEYRRLLDKVLVLPGFEFTATFGFHILGIFSPQTPVRVIEHLLLTLNIPSLVLEQGDPAAGSTADVLEAYRLIDEAGGLSIAAHINSTHGVMMRGLNFGGQTRMAYTQDRHLHALELTDLNRRGRESTHRFFNGTRPEYPRRMHCIQGSDAHSLDTFTEGKNIRFGVGERVTEMMLRAPTFEALHETLTGTDFSRTRPYTPDKQPYDYVLAAREEGPSLVQSFYESLDRKGDTLYAIVADACAFANGNGGTIYLGLGANKEQRPLGVSHPQDVVHLLQDEISHNITPLVDIDIDVHDLQGKAILRILVPEGDQSPYAVRDNRIYVRIEAETSLAVRDEIVTLVLQSLRRQGVNVPEIPLSLPMSVPMMDDNTSYHPSNDGDGQNSDLAGLIEPPRAGVEIMRVEDRGDTRFYTMHDLRNGSIVSNVTESSARRLWHYAIKQYESNPPRADKIYWIGPIGLWRRYEKNGVVRYDLAQHMDDSSMRVYYGVSESGMHGRWLEFLAPEEGIGERP